MNTVATLSGVSSAGNTIVEIGASYLHGPSEENPVFRLARYKGLLAPESLTAENQAMSVNEYLPGDHEWFSNSGYHI